MSSVSGFHQDIAKVRDSSLSTGEEAGRPKSRFVVGIDLGTTNSALCWCDTDDPATPIHCFGIPQVVGPNEVGTRETLPSFHYSLTEDSRRAGAGRLPWHEESDDHIVGVFARDQGRAVAGRLVESAKSWLCHHGVDRRAALLPWHAADDVPRLSPVEVSSRYLRHLRESWDASHPEYPLAEQDVVLTIPASFDEVARELTIAAARSAGMPRVILIEEPQAAFYAWVNGHRTTWEQQVDPGQKILVCDIGGGTSDFSLIHVRGGQEGRLQFHRVAVGDHLLLGGDNLDLALAHLVEEKLGGAGRLTPGQWSLLIPACRHAKETLLADNAPETHTIVISGTGSRLIGGSQQVEVRRDEVLQLAVDGFLPKVSLDARPDRRQSGFQEFGLPYAADPAISKYLAAFLVQHGRSYAPDLPAGLSARPDIVLFNGGFFASPILRKRLIDCLIQWFSTPESNWAPRILENDRLDLAVARGAAYFGLVRRGIGVRIVAGLARSYYIGVETANDRATAICLVSAGTEPGDVPVPIDRQFEVRTSQPVQFPILTSATRLTDAAGAVIDVDAEQMTSLPPIRTVLTTRRKGDQDIVSARISARLTEIGTLELWCEQTDGSRRWQLQFDVRSATETDRLTHDGLAEQTGIVDDEMVRVAQAAIHEAFDSRSKTPPDGLPKQIAARLGIHRHEWPPSLLRSMWAALMEHEDARRRSPQHEVRWLNLCGYCLRPGFGMAADDWRIEELWKTIRGKLIHASPACVTEWRILCRRIAGGLSAGRQHQLVSGLIAQIRQKHRQKKSGKGKAPEYASTSHEAAEIWRLLGSLELLENSLRTELGAMILDFLNQSSSEAIRPALLWAVGRMGARVPAYAPLNCVLPVSTAEDWARGILNLRSSIEPAVQLCLMQLCRKTDDRYRDVSMSLRDQVISELQKHTAKQQWIDLIRVRGQLQSEEAGLIMGEALPVGLRIL
ncbi:MAG: Hsp70 family protein [Planctomyces sp.]|nr:Hsp70 family protein [Planctomyces sp.]